NPDGVGAGELPDAAAYGDVGSDTLGNTARAVGGLALPTLARLGLGNLHPIAGVPPAARPLASWGRLREISHGKDSTTGHWELMGVVTEVPFPTYPHGFPPEVLEPFCAAVGRGALGNCVASGTEIIARLGDEHVRTGRPIVYTSADSVFQIAAHEEVVPLATLYAWCATARGLLVPPHNVSRVIARPFTGGSGHYVRTPNRRDFSVEPPAALLLPRLVAAGVRVTAVGKISDLYAAKGITEKIVAKGNAQGQQALAAAYARDPGGDALFLLNLVDFDMLWGHRNDPAGMAAELGRFDAWLAGWLPGLRSGDLLMITADHGNDPTTASTDHAREHVPLLALIGGGAGGGPLGDRATFADVGATVAEFFGVPAPAVGRSFLAPLRAAPAGGAA
ncbi:MAG: phosphopentomutase, partial [Candidatus Krumholzibacteriia bacterium]